VNRPCPVGHYCPNVYNEVSYLARYNAYPCPSGTYNPSMHGTSESDCLPCLSGHYCDSSNNPGLSEPTGKCSPGYYCPSDEPSRSPTSNICPFNHKCPEGTADPVPCPLGYYQTNTGSADCIICPPGSYCPRLSTSDEVINPIICNSIQTGPARAVYCPEGSWYEHPCPPGTYTSAGNTIGLSSIDKCNPCPRGKYCQEGKVQGPCTGGFLCISGADAPNPAYGQDDNGDDIIITPYLNDKGRVSVI